MHAPNTFVLSRVGQMGPGQNKKDTHLSYLLCSLLQIMRREAADRQSDITLLLEEARVVPERLLLVFLRMKPVFTRGWWERMVPLARILCDIG